MQSFSGTERYMPAGKGFTGISGECGIPRIQFYNTREKKLQRFRSFSIGEEPDMNIENERNGLFLIPEAFPQLVGNQAASF